jgi:hypothetical protein
MEWSLYILCNSSGMLKNTTVKGIFKQVTSFDPNYSPLSEHGEK